jgi:hypothetical protein
MCDLCDYLGQWICLCGAINRVEESPDQCWHCGRESDEEGSLVGHRRE